MKVFAGHALAQFLGKAEAMLRASFPVKTALMGSDALQRLIQGGIEKAAAYRIEERKDVLLYLHCQLQYGDNFDADPRLAWASKILKTRNFSGREKSLRLWKYVSAEH